MGWLADLGRDARYAARSLRRSPGFTVVATLTLALGLGANTALFSVVYGILLRPLPYRDADRIVVIEAYRNFAGRGTLRANYSLVDLEEWQAGAHAFESIAMAGVTTRTFAGPDGAQNVSAAIVSDGFFSILGSRFIAGRPLGPGDHGSAVVVISERLWRSRYGASPDIVGRQVRLKSQPVTVVGVVDASCELPNARVSAWIPAGQPGRRGSGGFNPIARLKPGVTLAQAQADVDEVTRQLARAYPALYEGATAVVLRLSQAARSNNGRDDRLSCRRRTGHTWGFFRPPDPAAEWSLLHER